MDKKTEQLLQNLENNHILPFLWVHGESPETYRRMIKAIHDANIRAFCVEARPHKNFCKEQWWQDMDVILDEAEKRNMQVWILDDKHFPTGFANGGVKKAPRSCTVKVSAIRRYRWRAEKRSASSSESTSIRRINMMPSR